MSVESVPDEPGDGMPVIDRALDLWERREPLGLDDVAALVAEVERLRGVLGVVVTALDDAIAHNVNATEHDPAGWTQMDYDTWDAARAQAEEALGDA